MTIDSGVIIEIALSAGIFIALWQLLSKLLFEPFLAVIEEREARTVGDEKNAAQVRVEAAEVAEKIEAELKHCSFAGIAAPGRIRQSCQG